MLFDARVAKSALLDEKEVARLYALSTTTLRNWRAKGEGPRFIKLGKRAVRYRLADLETFIAQEKA